MSLQFVSRQSQIEEERMLKRMLKAGIREILEDIQWCIRLMNYKDSIRSVIQNPTIFIPSYDLYNIAPVFAILAVLIYYDYVSFVPLLCTTVVTLLLVICVLKIFLSDIKWIAKSYSYFFFVNLRDALDAASCYDSNIYNFAWETEMEILDGCPFSVCFSKSQKTSTSSADERAAWTVGSKIEILLSEWTIAEIIDIKHKHKQIIDEETLVIKYNKQDITEIRRDSTKIRPCNYIRLKTIADTLRLCLKNGEFNILSNKIQLQNDKEMWKLESDVEDYVKWIHQWYSLYEQENVPTVQVEQNEKQTIQIEKKEEIREEKDNNEFQKHDGLIITWQFMDSVTNDWKSFDLSRSILIEKLKICETLHYNEDNQHYLIKRKSKDSGTRTKGRFRNDRVTDDIRRQKSDKQTNLKYPEWWNMTDLVLVMQDGYNEPTLYPMNLNKFPGYIVTKQFYTTASKYEIVKIESIQNQNLYDAYDEAKSKLSKTIGNDKLNEKDLYFGVKSESVMKQIESEGVKKCKDHSMIKVYGHGLYLARDAVYSIPYSYYNPSNIYKMFQCKVLCGEIYLGDASYELNKWPRKSDGSGVYDSLVDNKYNPSIFVINDTTRVYPMFVIHFKKKV